MIADDGYTKTEKAIVIGLWFALAASGGAYVVAAANFFADAQNACIGQQASIAQQPAYCPHK